MLAMREWGVVGEGEVGDGGVWCGKMGAGKPHRYLPVNLVPFGKGSSGWIDMGGRVSQGEKY